jgi:uncharacterized membrane protein
MVQEKLALCRASSGSVSHRFCGALCQAGQFSRLPDYSDDSSIYDSRNGRVHFPGGFGDFFNRRIFGIEAENGPMGETFIFAINVGLVWFLLPLFGILSFYQLELGLWVPYFAFFAGLAHIPLSIKGRKLYNPGLVVSLLLNIPGGAAVIWYLSAQGIIRQPLMNYHLLIGLGLNLLLPVMGLIVFRRYQRRTHQEASAHG